MLRRWQRWRLENAEAKLSDWRRKLDSAEVFGKGSGSRGLECRRVIARYERRVARLQAALGDDPDA